jgi:CDP-glycerol glycerophosphotransferase
MVFFTYDLDVYEHDIRGFYLDFRAESPGPLVATSDELAETLRDLGEVPAGYAERYRAFAAKYCELDDGGAAARVVERLFRL